MKGKANWFKRHKILTGILAIAALIALINLWYLAIVALVIIYFLPKRIVGSKIERFRVKVRKLLHSKPVTILLLVLLFPVGVYLMWRYMDWGKAPKFVISGLGTVVIVGVFILVVLFAPPTIAIKSSTAAIRGSQYTLVADITPDNATVTVNGKQVNLGSQGHLNTQLTLSQGDNRITIVARNTKNNKVTQQVITVHRYTTAEIAKQEQEAAAEKKQQEADAAQQQAAQAAADKAAQQQAVADAAAQQKQQAANAAAQKAAQQKSDENAIKAAVSKDLGGNNDVGGKYYRNIDVEPQANGGFGVFVDYNADEASSNNDDKTLYTEKAEQLYKTIYAQTGQDVRTASVSAWFAGTDQYGNNSDKLVYKTILDKSVADKVNWKADDATLQIDLPGLWSVTQDFLQ